MNIYAKLARASSLIGHIEKNGLNQHFKFKYQAWDDVLPAVRSACTDAGLWIVPSVKEVRTTDNIDRLFVDMTITVADTETGETITLDWCGESIAAKDDKGTQKAITSAFKYALLKLLMIPVVGDDDTDGDAGTIAAKPAPKRQPEGPTSNGNGSLDAAKAAMQELGITKDDWAPYAKVSYKAVYESWVKQKEGSKLDPKVLFLAIAKDMVSLEVPA